MQVGLDDKYRLEAKRTTFPAPRRWCGCRCCSASATALRGLNTAGFISGYRGSPLGVLRPRAVARRQASSPSTTSPSCPASTRTSPRPRCGAPSRSGCSPAPRSMACSRSGTARGPASTARGDALKHANSAGTSPHGGVLALAGDDHGCQSSTMAHQSEQVLRGRDDADAATRRRCRNISTSACIGFALSRFSGCWVGFKAISETVESPRLDRKRSRRASDRAADRFRDAAGRVAHPLARPAAGAEARLLGPKMDARCRVRARQPAR